MKKLLAYILTPVFYFSWGLSLAIFHPIQYICLKLGGYHAHKKSVDALNFCLTYSLIFLGTKIRIKGKEKLPKGRPLIVVSNHQGFFDISPIGWIIKKHHVKFISKIELAKNIPSISFNLKHGGSAIIDRANGSQSIREIIKLGRFIEKNNYSACIFPEGTRSKAGIVKPFKEAGLKTLLKTAPSSLVVPFVIDGHNRLMKWGYFPLSVGETITYTILDAIDPKEIDLEAMVIQSEQTIKKELKQA